MTLHALFPTRVYESALQRGGSRALNLQLLKECLQLRADDLAGRRWSKRNYPGGYTSYGSAHRLQLISPTFQRLQSLLDRHVALFAAAVEWDLTGRRLEMTDCWVNIMPAGTVHGLHLHPLATVSGTYYVRAAARSPGLKFEDPRLDRFMAAPPRKANAQRDSRPWITFPATPGRLLLFESWLRHEVAANTIEAERISVSFNYNWF
jgi:uncharacterized protein (TIGR02466 family)